MTKKELEDLNNDIIVVVDHLIDMSYKFMMTVKPDASIFELRGLVLSTIYEGLQEREHKNAEQLQQIREAESSKADESRPDALPEDGKQGRIEESPKGDSPDETGKENPNDSKESNNTAD